MANPKGKDSYLGPLVLSTMEQVLNPVLVFNLILILIFLIFDFWFLILKKFHIFYVKILAKFSP